MPIGSGWSAPVNGSCELWRVSQLHGPALAAGYVGAYNHRSMGDSYDRYHMGSAQLSAPQTKEMVAEGSLV